MERQADSLDKVAAAVDALYLPYRTRTQALYDADETGMYDGYKQDVTILRAIKDRRERDAQGLALIDKYAEFMADMSSRAMPDPRPLREQVEAVLDGRAIVYGAHNEYLIYNGNLPHWVPGHPGWWPPREPSYTDDLYECGSYDQAFHTPAPSTSSTSPCGLFADAYASAVATSASAEATALLGLAIAPPKYGFDVYIHHDYTAQWSLFNLILGGGSGRFEIGIRVTQGANVQSFVHQTYHPGSGGSPIWHITHSNPDYYNNTRSTVYVDPNGGPCTVQALARVRTSVGGLFPINAEASLNYTQIQSIDIRRYLR